MSFDKSILEESPGLSAGEVIKTKPNNIEGFETFENGAISGRFVKYDGGSIDMLDGSDTPKIAGVLKRKINNAIGVDTYNTSGENVDQMAEVFNFGMGTVSIVSGNTPVKYGPAYAHNANDADAGKATTTSTSNAATGAIFWEEISTDVWLVLIPQYLV